MSITKSGKGLKKPTGHVDIGFIGTSTDILEKAVTNELGIGKVPSRPFMRRTIDMHKQEIYKMAIRAISEVMMGNMSNSTMLKSIGKFVAGLMRNEINTANQWAKPLSDQTKRRKNSDKILIDTGAMYSAISFKEHE